ncbi:MAG: hypothetical protein B6244_00700 [Candidatus Cloacimonetes bacterium 4572_55]|nr:MAG: hypothetical protein B6244_00700 [Candidatus Cloacimonetes bacterium 4572_55]
MKYLNIIFIIVLSWTGIAYTQPLERLIYGLPLFAAGSHIKAVDETLTIGVFSDSKDKINKETLTKFKDIKTWSNDRIRKIFELQKLEIVSLNSENLTDFAGQIIWVLDASASLEKLKEVTANGIFTIAAQDPGYEDYVFVTSIYENKSSDPDVERWRLTRFFVNCEVSQLRPSSNLKTKDGYVEKNCD